MLELTFTNPIRALQHLELTLVALVQRTLSPAEPAWIFLSEQFTPARLLDIYVPLVGAFNHQLLVRLVCSLGVINALTSLLKWSFPAFRPYWWIREYNETTALQQFDLTCETTAGFPCSHSIAFTTYAFLTAVFLLPTCCRKLQLDESQLARTCRAIVLVASVSMALSRVYLAAQFPHQCIVSSLAAIVLLHIFDQSATVLYTLSRLVSVLLVLSLALLPVVWYFAMLRLDVDPHWSVRMAFKWCADPTFLRHEASPIFVLGRDLGHLLGVALSTPIYTKYEAKAKPVRRIPLLLALELLNYYARQQTPKQRGRFVFVAYECLRNVIHAFTLLTMIPKVS